MPHSATPTSVTLDPVAQALLDHSPATARTEPHLRAVLDHAIGTPGKRVRARLVQAAARAHGLDADASLQLATAVEYFHLSSLLLDDLPCMDDAQTRRGRPCAHRVHGEASTILAALALVNRAYALVGFALAGLPGFVRLQAQACLDACLGPSGLVGGQAADLRFAESDRSARTAGRIAAAKTGALFWLAVYLPALISGPGPRERRSLKALCVYWGLAFQAIDDLGDVLATSVESGKTTGRDRALTRPNLALALGVPAVRTRIARLSALAEREVANLFASDPKRYHYLAGFQQNFSVISSGAASHAA